MTVETKAMQLQPEGNLAFIVERRPRFLLSAIGGAASKEQAMRSLLFLALFSLTAPALTAGEPAAAPAERSPATVRVTLPADATLTIDGQATQSTSGQRLFVSPPLDAGKRYSYTFRARFLRAGKTMTVEQEVFVRAGRETRVSLEAPAESAGGYSTSADSATPDDASPDTRGYYAAPELPAPPRAGRYLAPSAGNGQRGPRDDRPSSAQFIHWGTDPSDPFYHSGQ
jgi:uncharacterized protein (TIGR03000 family)